MRRSSLMATPSLRKAAFLVAACLGLACGCKDHTVPAVAPVPPAITSPDDNARVAPDNKGLPDGVSPNNFVEVKEAEIGAKTSRLPVALDGEVRILHTPLKYRSRTGALHVIAPARTHG